MKLSPDIVWTFLTEHFGAGVAVAVPLTGLTATVLLRLPRDDNDGIALWPMGASGGKGCAGHERTEPTYGLLNDAADTAASVVGGAPVLRRHASWWSVLWYPAHLCLVFLTLPFCGVSPTPYPILLTIYFIDCIQYMSFIVINYRNFTEG